jgi:hypothetical protein
MRIGRHMTHQSTLLEALTGVEILENNYYAIANWAARCPDTEIIGRASHELEIMSKGLINPATTMAREASIISMRCEMLKKYHPDGPWAEMLLEAIGEYVPTTSEEELKAKVSEVVAARGVPADVLKDEAKFDARIDRIQQLWVECFEKTSVAMTLPPMARARLGKEIFDRYSGALKRLGDDDLLNPAEIGTFFSMHSAELAMARVVLALAASRSEQGYPESLDAIASRFGGQVPVNPYDGKPMQYTVSEDRNDFTLTVPEVSDGDILLPKIEFSTAGKK